MNASPRAFRASAHFSPVTTAGAVEFVGTRQKWRWGFVVPRVISGIRFITDAACRTVVYGRAGTREPSRVESPFSAQRQRRFEVYDNFRYTLLNGEVNGHNKLPPTFPFSRASTPRHSDSAVRLRASSYVGVS